MIICILFKKNKLARVSRTAERHGKKSCNVGEYRYYVIALFSIILPMRALLRYLSPIGVVSVIGVISVGAVQDFLISPLGGNVGL